MAAVALDAAARFERPSPAAVAGVDASTSSAMPAVGDVVPSTSSCGGGGRLAHILCGGQQQASCAGTRPRLSGGTVLALGMHCSGTKVLSKYIRAYFRTKVEPPEKTSRRVDDGTAVLGDLSFWKHSAPKATWPLPGRDPDGGSVTVLLTIREPGAWLLSLSRNPYEVFRKGEEPGKCQKRKKNDVRWLLDEIWMNTGGRRYHDPFPRMEYASAVHLWALYAKGYLNLHMADQSSPTFIVVKYEDLLEKPEQVIQELADLGLPRNDVPFAPIHEGIGGSLARTELLEKQRQGCAKALEKAGGWRVPALLRELCPAEMQALGYA
eukprot:TRINITY_DN17526_c0_g1_i1.p1 TRINITY_DN17526_c0_g1~~TRINITY_DN17526_c0_g1_i1.p1  ORF type:complete len:340 (-),score=71.91 TRINITY_DN17526_c0_g1_i1:173-1141(-)